MGGTHKATVPLCGIGRFAPLLYKNGNGGNDIAVEYHEDAKMGCKLLVC